MSGAERERRRERRIARGDLEAVAARVRGLIEARRFGDAYAGPLADLWSDWAPREPGEEHPAVRKSIYVPDPLGRPDGIELSASASGKADRSYTSHYAIRASDAAVDDDDRSQQHSVSVAASLLPGLHPLLYEHEKPVMGSDPVGERRRVEWVRWPHLSRDALRLAAAGALDDLAGAVVRASGHLARIMAKVGAPADATPEEAWPHVLEWAESRRGSETSHLDWTGMRDALLAAKPPPRWGVEPPNATGFGWAWAVSRRLDEIVLSIRGAISAEPAWSSAGRGTPYPSHDGASAWYGRVTRDYTTRLARRSSHSTRVEVTFPTNMGFTENEEMLRQAPAEGRFRVAVHDRMPSTVQGLAAEIVREIRRAFPDSAVRTWDPRDFSDDGREVVPPLSLRRA